ncbi:MAG: hypothetical protein FWE71_00235 [Nocardioidaceae bacterium]|nr:hypothetical protein [Nocardioidaceae bacterium]MCL2612790.1 hypothetical protein [Nocardioidaceae bacterium]
MSLITKRLAVVAATAAAATSLTFASSSASYADGPTAAEALSACPTDGNGALCLATQTTGGQFSIGKMTMPLGAMVFTGTVSPDPNSSADNILTNASLNGPALQVPGGLLGVPAVQSLIPGITSVTASTELAGVPHFNAGASLTGVGTALTLPIKIKLGNALLGNNCTIGTDADPIVLSLTAGTTAPPAPNQPIKGSTGTLGVDGGTIVITGSSFVDNSFSVPKASGCTALGLQLLESTVSGIVNSKQGLPSPAGNNTIVMNANAWLGVPPAAATAG